MNRDLTKKELEDQVVQLQKELYKMTLAEQKCQGALESKQQQQLQQQLPRFLDKIVNPLSGTSPDYPGGSFSTPPYDAFRQYQMLGYLSGPTGQFPVMGRYKYSGKTDKFEYYTINNDRGRIKINFKNKNDEELYDGDTVSVPQITNEALTFYKYENTDGNRYDPNVI